MNTSARYGVQYPSATRLDSADVPRDFAAVVAGLENSAMYGQGTLAARPTSSGGTPGIQGRLYAATDQSPQKLYYDYGTGWFEIGALAAGSVGATQIADRSITAIKHVLDSITGAEIAALAVGTAELADASVTLAKIAAALKPSGGALGTDEALRALGTAATNAAPGQHHTGHQPGGADAIDWTTVNRRGTLGARPSATGLAGVTYTATDVNSGTIYLSDGATWNQIAAGVSGATTPAAHASTHLANATDALAWTTIHGKGTLAARPAAAASNSGYTYLSTDTLGGTISRSDGTQWTQQAAGVLHGASAHGPAGADPIPAGGLEARQVNVHRGSSPPGSPADGDEWEYTVDATNGIYWRFRYNAGSASAYKWEFIGGPPLVGFDNNDEGSGGGFQPAVNPRVTLPRSGDYYMSFKSKVRGQPNALEQPQWTITMYVVGVGLLTPSSAYMFIQGGTSGILWQAQLAAGPTKQTGRTAGDVIALWATVANWDFVANQKTIELLPIRVS